MLLEGRSEEKLVKERGNISDCVDDLFNRQS